MKANSLKALYCHRIFEPSPAAVSVIPWPAARLFKASVLLLVCAPVTPRVDPMVTGADAWNAVATQMASVAAPGGTVIKLVPLAAWIEKSLELPDTARSIRPETDDLTMAPACIVPPANRMPLDAVCRPVVSSVPPTLVFPLDCVTEKLPPTANVVPLWVKFAMEARRPAAVIVRTEVAVN